MTQLVDIAQQMARTKLEVVLPRRLSHVRAVAAKARRIAAAVPRVAETFWLLALGCMMSAIAPISSTPVRCEESALHSVAS
ncbi:hypothetical protein ACPSM1_19555 [Micromonospora chersina]|uniref:hypothetical protein n=1 Tax=Micromonospora chersina TaxID=47854 RepID=UPI003C9DF06B